MYLGGGDPVIQVKAVGDQSGAYEGNKFQKPRPRTPGEVPGTPYLTMQVGVTVEMYCGTVGRGSSQGWRVSCLLYIAMISGYETVFLPFFFCQSSDRDYQHIHCAARASRNMMFSR